MKSKKPDVFNTFGVSQTAAAPSQYTTSDTMRTSEVEQLVPRSEITHVREVINQHVTYISKQIEDLKVSVETRSKELQGYTDSKIIDVNNNITSRENRFWWIVSIGMTLIATIFLYILPDLYKKDYNDRISEISKKLDKRIDIIETIVVKPKKK